MKKTKSALILSVVAALALSAVLTACGGKKQPPVIETPEVSITLSASEAQMDIGDVLLLTAQVSGSDETPVWTSSRPESVTVSDGMLTAVATGNAEITASVTGAVTKCSVRVIDSMTAPVLVLDETDLSIAEGSVYGVKASLLWKGASVDGEAEFVWSIADGAPQDVATVATGQNGAADITGVKAGETRFVVSAVYRGTLVAQTLRITVKDLSDVIDVPGLDISSGGYSLTIYALAYGNFSDFFELDPTVYSGGSEVIDPPVVWSVDDENVVRAENGRITAVNVGSTVVTGTYGTAAVEINVEVKRTEIPLMQTVTVDVSRLKPIVLDNPPAAVITDALFKGRSVFGSYSGGTLTLDASGISKTAEGLGDGKLSLVSDKADYLIDASFYTMVINDAGDLNAMKAMADDAVTGANETSAANKQWDGYFVLGNDIIYNAPYANWAMGYFSGWNSVDETGDYRYGFGGVFDGKGHSITGLKTSEVGFVWCLRKSGVIRNVSFLDAEINGGNVNCTYVCSFNAGMIENVYVQMKSVTFSQSTNKLTLFSQENTKGRGMIKDCFTDASAMTVSAPSGAVYELWFTGQDDCNNVNTFALCGEYAALDTAASGKRKVYSSAAQMKADADAQAIIAGWSQFWTVVDGVPRPSGNPA